MFGMASTPGIGVTVFVERSSRGLPERLEHLVRVELSDWLSAITMDFRTSPSSASMTSHAATSSSLTTAIAAGASNEPANTARRSNTARSRSVNSP